MDDVSRLVRALRDARDFEQAATLVLRRMLQVTQEALEESWPARGRVLRGMVHLRPGQGYRGLAVMEHGADVARTIEPRPTAPGEVPPPLTSVTAWRAVSEHRCAVSIDVNLSALQVHTPGGTIQPHGHDPDGESFDSNESRLRFLARQASHVCVIPLRSPSGEVDGMISLEAECPSAIGDEFIWRTRGSVLQDVADIAAPYLSALPLRSVSIPATDEFLPVIGSAMAELLPILQVFAQQNETLLISGATGTGKSRLARWCHERSPRRNRPFETLDLLTVAPDLQMARLFGWRKGAFTGAVRDMPGLVALAEGGTLFIDEIDKLSIEAQAGLLRLLEERTYRVVGDDSGDLKADVRFIIGTNVDLRSAVRAGRFREDLYFRINVLPIAVLPLDQRRDEIPRWAHYMINRRHRRQFPDGVARLTPEAEERLLRQAWPGNLRQLDNIVCRAYALALVGRDQVSREVVLEAQHVESALTLEGVGPEQPQVIELFRAVALAFLAEAERRQGGLELELTDALRGLVLALAAEKLGVERAFRLFGREKLVTSRNHRRTLRRELEKVEALYRAFGLESGWPLAELLVEDDEET